MNIILTENYSALCMAAADRIVAIIREKPDATLVVATGDTPMGVYRELAERRRQGALDTSRIQVFQLDAYLGIEPHDRRSLFRWMRESFIEPLGIAPEQVVRLPGDTPDPQAACRAYDEAVTQAGGFDLSILGLGPNGHLGFNERPAHANAPTRVVALTEASIASNARYWGGRDQVPPTAITAGMRALLAARQTLLLVSGAHKRDILRRTVEGPIGPENPASFLRTISGVSVLADHDAWGADQ